jgi:hypothetical protein
VTGGRDGFEPDGLPDPGGGCVPDAAGLAGLLAAGLWSGIGGVPDLDDEFLVASADEVLGDVEGEGVVATSVGADAVAVHEDDCFEVYRSEVEQDAVAVPGGRDAECASVVDTVMALHDAGEGGLDGEGDEDASLVGFAQGRRLEFGGRDAVLPEAVEVEPLGADALRPWVRAVDAIGGDVGGPPGHEGSFVRGGGEGQADEDRCEEGDERGERRG